MVIEYNYGSFELKAEDVRDEYFLCELLNMMSEEDSKKLEGYVIAVDGEGPKGDFISTTDFTKAKKTDMSYFIIKSIEIGFGGM